jgi:hypothetical protein
VNLSKNCDRVRLHEKEATASDAVADGVGQDAVRVVDLPHVAFSDFAAHVIDDLLLQRRQKENFKALITQKQSYKCVACHAASRDM